MIDIPKYNEEELLDYLQDYQREIVQELLKTNSADEALELWMSANGPINNANFGGTQEKNQLLQNFKIEFCKLLSEYPEYENNAKEIKTYLNLGKEAVISSLTLALAPKMGTAAVILVPLVVLGIISISKVGIKAYCNSVLKNEKG